LVDITNPAYFTLLILSTCSLVLTTSVTFPNVYSSELNKNDYLINNFGIKDGNPWMTVQGTAGGSYDPSMGDEGYDAYVFQTNKGIFQITVAQSTSTNGTPLYSTERIISNQTGEGDCLQTEDTNAEANFDNHTATYFEQNLKVTKIKKVSTIQVSLDDPSTECPSGVHVNKIYSFLTKPAFSSN